MPKKWEWKLECVCNNILLFEYEKNRLSKFKTKLPRKSLQGCLNNKEEKTIYRSHFENRKSGVDYLGLPIWGGNGRKHGFNYREWKIEGN